MFRIGLRSCRSRIFRFFGWTRLLRNGRFFHIFTLCHVFYYIFFCFLHLCDEQLFFRERFSQNSSLKVLKEIFLVG